MEKFTPVAEQHHSVQRLKVTACSEVELVFVSNVNRNFKLQELLCGCVMCNGTVNTAEVDGGMNSSKYLQILEASRMQSVKRLKLKRD